MGKRPAQASARSVLRIHLRLHRRHGPALLADRAARHEPSRVSTCRSARCSARHALDYRGTTVARFRPPNWSPATRSSSKHARLPSSARAIAGICARPRARLRVAGTSSPPTRQVAAMIADPRLRGVSLTAPSRRHRGRRDGGRNLTKCVLELGGSDRTSSSTPRLDARRRRPGAPDERRPRATPTSGYRHGRRHEDFVGDTKKKKKRKHKPRQGRRKETKIRDRKKKKKEMTQAGPPR